MTQNKLSFWTKLAYGSGDWGTASYGTLRQIFYAIFLTDVVGLEPRLASVAALVGIIWDAINDPVIGTLTDRMRSRWGRRRPFLLFFSVPYGLSFMLLWWAPPFESQIGKAIFVTLAFIISDTLATLVEVPFSALTPELTRDYDERTTLTGFRMFFNLVVSLVTAVAAPAINDAVLAAGLTQQQGYLITAALFGGMAIVPFLIIFAVVREGPRDVGVHEEPAFLDTVKMAWSNIPFRFATTIYMLNWITFDIVALALPFFLTYWVARGDLVAKANLFGAELPLESAVFAALLVTAVLALPVWIFIAMRSNKRSAYIGGMFFWAVVQLGIFSIQPGQVTLVLWMAMLAGISVSSAHILPDSIFPDVIEWDELRTGRRQEGIYYGVKNFIRKCSGAVAIFIALQVLGWFGYQSPAAGATQFQQSEITLSAIRFVIGPLGALLLFSAITMAWFYPLTREQHGRIRRLLERKKGRAASD